MVSANTLQLETSSKKWGMFDPDIYTSNTTSALPVALSSFRILSAFPALFPVHWAAPGTRSQLLLVLRRESPSGFDMMPSDQGSISIS
jgi:hypothetical protein